MLRYVSIHRRVGIKDDLSLHLHCSSLCRCRLEGKNLEITWKPFRRILVHPSSSICGSVVLCCPLGFSLSPCHSLLLHPLSFISSHHRSSCAFLLFSPQSPNLLHRRSLCTLLLYLQPPCRSLIASCFLFYLPFPLQTRLLLDIRRLTFTLISTRLFN